MQAGVLSLIHHAHAATAEILDDAIVRDCLTDHGPSLQGSGRMLMCSPKASQRSWLDCGLVGVADTGICPEDSQRSGGVPKSVRTRHPKALHPHRSSVAFLVSPNN